MADFNVTLVFRGREDASVKRTMARMKSEAAGLSRSLGASSESSGGAFGAWGGGRQSGKNRGAIFSRQDARAWAKKGQFAPAASPIGKGDSFFDAGNFANAAAGMSQLTGMAKSAVGTPLELAMEFEKSLKMVNALSGGALAASGKIKDIEKVSRSMSKQTEFSAKAVADGFGILTQAGLPVEDQLKEIRHVLDFATAGEVDMASAAQFLVDAVGGFNLQFSETERVGNAMARAAMASQINLKDMGEAFKYSAPLAADLGISVEQTSTAIALLGKAGVKGSMAGTGLRSFFNRISNPRTDAQKGILKHLGISKEALRTAIDSQDLPKVLQLWADGFARKGIKGSKRLAILQTFFQERGGLAADVLIKSVEALPEAANSWKTFDAAVNDSTKSLGAMATMAREGLHGEVNRLNKSMEDLGITIGQKLGPAVSPLIEDLTKVVDKVAAWAEKNPLLVRQLGMILIGIVAAGIVLTPVLLAMSAFKGVLGLVAIVARGGAILLGAKGLAGAVAASGTAAAAASAGGWATMLATWSRGILIAGALGYAAGTALDEWLGLSDSIAGVDQNKFGGRGNVALGDLTEGEKARLEELTAKRDEGDEVVNSWTTWGSPLRDAGQKQRNEAQMEIDKIQNAARARKRQLEGAQKAAVNGAPMLAGAPSVPTAASAADEEALRKALESANFQGGTIKLQLPPGVRGEVVDQGAFPIEIESGINPEGM